MGAGPLSKEPSVAAKFFDNSSTAITAKAQAFAGPGNLWRMVVENNNAAVGYLQFFDLAVASVTVGTTPPIVSYAVPASGAIVLDPSDFPLHFFAVACTVAATTTRAGSSAGSLNVKFWYKN